MAVHHCCRRLQPTRRDSETRNSVRGDRFPGGRSAPMPWRGLALLMFSPLVTADVLHDDLCTVGTSLLQTNVVAHVSDGMAPVVRHLLEKRKLAASDEQQRTQCMAADLEKVLKGWKDEGEKVNLNKYLGLPMFLLLLGSLLVLLAGHRLVTVVVLISVILASFFLTFEALWRSLENSCDAPIWVAVLVSLVAGSVALCCLELAVVVPGALFGAILAYQIQEILVTASAQLASNVFVVKYYFIIAILAAILFGYLAHRLKDDIFILITSVLGAYGLEISIRAIMLDYFSSEMSALASLILMFSAFIIGLVVQLRTAK